MSSTDRQPDLAALLDLLSVPRPNGSRALDETAAALRKALDNAGIPHRSQRFSFGAYFNELLGGWLLLSGLALAASVWLRWGWPSLLLALLVVLVPTLETRFLIPVITGLLRRQAENLICQFPAKEPQHEAIFAAHYDSKTELLDHRQRQLFVANSRRAMMLALLAGIAATIDQGLRAMGSEWAIVAFGVGAGSATLAALFGVGLGSNLLLGRWRRAQSQGAVDNGAAVAALIVLGARLQRGEPTLQHTSVTIVLFTGEEVQMQGSRHYVATRQDWPLPVSVINLEAVGQNGDYVLWEHDGTALNRYPTDADLNAALDLAVYRVTGQVSQRLPLINSDAMPFLRAGYLAAVLGSLHEELGVTGLHSPLDRRERVHAARVRQCTDILVQWLRFQERAQ